MKRFIMAPLFCLISSIAGAQSTQTSKPILCFPIDQLLKEIKEVNEEPQWMGTSTDGESKYLLVVNKKDNSWTIIQFNGKMGCVLGLGVESKLVFKMI